MRKSMKYCSKRSELIKLRFLFWHIKQFRDTTSFITKRKKIKEDNQPEVRTEMLEYLLFTFSCTIDENEI